MGERPPEVAPSFCLPTPCFQLRCTVTAWREPLLRGIWYQHGENREHRRLFLCLALTGDDNPVQDWLIEAHEYEACSA